MEDQSKVKNTRRTPGKFWFFMVKIANIGLLKGKNAR